MIMTIHPATALQSPLPPKTPQLTSPLSARLKSHLSRLQPSSPTIKYQNVNTTVKSTTPNGHLQLELMPIDNNCLFNSIAFLFLDRVRSKSHLIRKLLASTARTHPNTRVSEEIAVLAGEYAHAIERDQGLLGGDAELDFLAEHFQCQLVVVFVRAYTAAEIEASRELQLLNQQHQLAEKHSKQQPPLTITEIKRYGSEQLPNRAFLRRGINSYYCPISLRRSPMNFWSLNNNRQSNSVGPAPSRSAENLFNPNSDGGYNHQQYNSNTVMTVFNDKSDYLLAKVVSLCESIKERRLKPLAPLSYYRVDRHTVYSWISKAILVGAGIALVFAILILAGVKPIAF
jgi:hypothetical protein